MIYKRDTLGNIRTLQVEAVWDTVESTAGLIDGKKVKHIKSVTEKNIWRSNYRTAKQVAFDTALSILKKKLKWDYFENVDDIDSGLLIKPMLAKPFSDDDEIVYSEIRVQPKLDGMRCIAYMDGKWDVVLYSRDNNIISTVPHINWALNKYRWEPMVLDWELYYHGWNFQENMRLLKKNVPGETGRLIKYVVYDRCNAWEMKYLDRFYTIPRTHYESVQYLGCSVVNDKNDLVSIHQKYLSEWYEGTMIRDKNSPYHPWKRSKSLIKMKDFDDLAATIIEIVPYESDNSLGKLIVKSLEGPSIGKIFEATLKWTNSQKRSLITDPESFIWLTAEIRYFWLSEKLIPRIGVAVWIRLDK